MYAEARHRRLGELNVIEQCLNAFKTGTVQRSRVQQVSLHSNAIARYLQPSLLLIRLFVLYIIAITKDRLLVLRVTIGTCLHGGPADASAAFPSVSGNRRRPVPLQYCQALGEHVLHLNAFPARSVVSRWKGTPSVPAKPSSSPRSLYVSMFTVTHTHTHSLASVQGGAVHPLSADETTV